MKVRSIRGATTVSVDSKEEISDSIVELLGEIFRVNQISEGDLISILFTATPDLKAEFPATAARRLGLADTPLICAAELDITGALSRCLRVLVTTHSNLEKSEIRHVYLRDAVALRKDIQ